MPGKLDVDPLRDGRHAFKPIVAAAYCAGALWQRQGNFSTPPAGLNGESLENWSQGYADALAGDIHPGCSMAKLGPEVNPDPLFRNWTGSPLAPTGWTQTGNDGANFWESGAGDAAAHCVSDAASAFTPSLSLPGSLSPSVLYQVQFRYSQNDGPNFIILTDGFPSTELVGGNGELVTLQVEAQGIQPTLNDGTPGRDIDATLDFFSMKIIY